MSSVFCVFPNEPSDCPLHELWHDVLFISLRDILYSFSLIGTSKENHMLMRFYQAGCELWFET